MVVDKCELSLEQVVAFEWMAGVIYHFICDPFHQNDILFCAHGQN